jgi:DHA3 family macrolide efflux protein-like MFS transporter
MTPMTMGPFYAMIQANVAPDMQARIFSLLSSVGSAMVPFGLLVAGPIADLAGIQVWFLFGGTACVLMALTGVCIPAVINIERQGEPGESMAVAAST